jgi:hypothetical protein
MGAGHDLQGSRHGGELLLGQASREVPSDAVEMGPGRLPQSLSALSGQPGPHDPGVPIVSTPVHQSPIDKAIHGSGQPAGRQHDPLGQFGHVQRSLRGPGQPKQDVVRGHGEAVLGPKLHIEGSGHLLMRMQEGLPCAELLIGQPGRHTRMISFA